MCTVIPFCLYGHEHEQLTSYSLQLSLQVHVYRIALQQQLITYLRNVNNIKCHVCSKAVPFIFFLRVLRIL